MNTSNPIPAGLIDKNVELFSDKGKLYGTHNGQVKCFSELPRPIQQIIARELINDQNAQKALDYWQTSELSVWTYEQLLERYAKCKWGGFDHQPDILNGKAQNGEYWKCGVRATCHYQGKICKQIETINGHLTWREVEVLKLIHSGLQDKEIAAQLELSVQTVPSYKKNIREKTGCRSKIELAVFAEKMNIV